MKTVLFDLDGTITQPASGIIGSFRYALQELGAVAPPQEELGWVIGPALRESFEKFLGSKEKAEQAVGFYRKNYGDKGIFDAYVFDGIPEALTTLQKLGYQLFVCTAKPHIFARRVIEHFQLDRYFSGIYGPELDGRMDDKAELLAHIIHENQLKTDSCCLIGDRLYDAIAARKNGVLPIGALWGFGSLQELEEAGATSLCSHPDELVPLITALIP